MSEARRIHTTVNGVPFEGHVSVRWTLADFLRNTLELTGTHLGCEHGVCGACTVQVEGRSVRGCLMLAVQADGKEVHTVEGLGDPSDSHGLGVLQKCMKEHFALQCGYCTSGILMSLHELLRDRRQPDADEVRAVLSGHLCRCTGYEPIVTACLAAADLMAKEEVGRT